MTYTPCQCSRCGRFTAACRCYEAEDLADSRAALAEARAKGTKPLTELKQELGIGTPPRDDHLTNAAFGAGRKTKTFPAPTGRYDFAADGSEDTVE